MIINDLYGTSGNCQMITNTLYAGAETVRMAGPDCSAPYEDVDRAGGTNPPPRPCRSSGVDIGDYVDQEEIWRTERMPRNQQPEGGAMYVDVEEIRRNKARNKGKAKKGEDKEAEGGAMYVDVEEIRRNKARDKGKAKKGEDKEAEGGAMYVDAEEIRRNKARDKGKAKKVSGPKADD
ncbi:uncharacterized protein LOC143291494 [Babylonia areolata]|uniref:uncharacterized protein LOC143291494 n=1 Tax=Babylonia areolata TaxID=304850 RepID=UPI003FD6B878